MIISDAGVAAIKQREGYRLKAYRDSRGVPTIGVGHTGSDVRMSRIWTEQKVDDTLRADLQRFEDVVNHAVKVPLKQSQFDACVSLAFNIGVNGFAGSSVVKQLNLRNFPVAAADFLMWDRPPELLARRHAEMAQFLGGGA